MEAPQGTEKVDVMETIVEEDQPSEQVQGSHKITNFFPVLKSEGRAKMCSSKSGDSKQKEILQKLITTPKVKKAQEVHSSTESQPKLSRLSREIARGGMKVSSALKTPLSQVLRRSIEASELKKEGKSAETEKVETDSQKITISENGNRKAKKSFTSNGSSAFIKKLPPSGLSHSAKAFTSTSRLHADEDKFEANFESKSVKDQLAFVPKSSELSATTASIAEDTISNKIGTGVKIPHQKHLESALKLSVTTEDASLGNASPSAKNLSKGKKRTKRHFRGGTYGLYLTKKKKKKQKSSPESGGKDDECSLAGTENSSYIDSDDGNSSGSDDFNTPSEKSLADDEPSLDSRNSPMLLTSDAKNTSPESNLPHENQLEKQQNDNLNEDSKSDMCPKESDDHSIENSATKDDSTDMKWETVTPNESLLSQSEFNEALKAPEYDDISNESFSNTTSFSFNKESLLDSIEDTEMQDSELFGKSKDSDPDLNMNNDSISNNTLPMDSLPIEPNNDISITSLLQDINSDISQNKESIGNRVSTHEESFSNAMMEEGIKADDVLNIAPDTLKNEENHMHCDDEKEESDAQFSTIATSVKSRQRIKRRFTDDVVDTDVGILSINSMLTSRKAPPKPELPPIDVSDLFMPPPNREARIGPITKLECIYSTRQPLVDSCTCQGDTYEARLNKNENIYCQAVDSVDDKLVGCCNTVITSQLVRSSVKIPFTVMCEMHLWRLAHHHSCPYCGLFCTQGSFIQCLTVENNKKTIHLFHEHCQVKDEGHVPFCLHCGDTSKLKTVELEMNMTCTPTFYLSQQPTDPIPKARITFTSSAKKENETEQNSDKTYTIAETGKVLSSVGLPDGPNQVELDKLIKILNSNEPVSASYTLEDFYSAAVEGDISKILDMLALGFDPNHKFVEHECATALHAAAEGNHLTVLHLLIQAGAVNDCLNERIYTPLMLATEKNHKDIVQYLVRKGSLTDFRGENGMTSIHIAAKSGNLELLKMLMRSRKVDVNAQDDGGWTSIVWASEHDHYDVVKYLLERGANPNIKDNEGNTGLHWSAFSGSNDICFLYLDYGCEIDAVNEHGDTPLHIAARQDSHACVSLFLSRGANVQIQNKANQLPAECCLDKNGQTYLQLSLSMLLKKITGKYQHKAERILHRDISRGKEQLAIQCVNAVDNEPPPFNFLYVTENCETMPINIDRTITSLQSCHCEDDCTTINCTCAQISFRCWYDKEGCLLPDFNMIDPPMLFECNRACSCWSLNCRNRILQSGITCRLQLIRTKGKGWGVRTLKDIPKGAFICEYVGELISDSEADKREDDSYLFDLDNRDGETYCLDARYYGNVSRFINHLCEPNLVPVKVFVDHQDLSFPRIAFFSSREIKQYEELGFDYGEKFWSIKYKWFTCDCGTPKCKYSKDAIHETLANYYRRLKEEQLEESAHSMAT